MRGKRPIGASGGALDSMSARRRAVLSEADFLSWLNLSNARLESQTPIDVIRAGRADVVANLVEDLLTGAPG